MAKKNVLGGYDGGIVYEGEKIDIGEESFSGSVKQTEEKICKRAKAREAQQKEERTRKSSMIFKGKEEYNRFIFNNG